jgi:nitrogen-specific signal transduction histidine kinase/CheY-like chemotaxis protein
MRLRELTQEVEREVRERTLELREANESLRQSDRRKDEFLAMLAHELRNPLGPILSSTYVLERAVPANAPVGHAVRVIQRQTKHLARLVDDLLDVTRIARGKIELRREPLDLREVVRRTGEDLRVLFDTRGIELTIEIPEQPLRVDGDPVRLAQIIGNLLQNAQKFTEAGGHVTLSVARAADESVAEIRVRDTGAGIHAELLPHVFEPFVQGDASLARTEGGLGLGLALVKAVAELHGGSVSASSSGPNRGAELAVRLPLLGGQPVHLEARASPSAATRHRVLVVDDNRDAAEGLAHVVRMLGHVCEVAYDGPGALVAVETIHPDVVLCDLGLPGMSGFDVAKTLREGGSAARLVAISGYTQPADLKKASSSGFDIHMAKPVDLDALQRLLG